MTDEQMNFNLQGHLTEMENGSSVSETATDRAWSVSHRVSKNLKSMDDAFENFNSTTDKILSTTESQKNRSEDNNETVMFTEVTEENGTKSLENANFSTEMGIADQQIKEKEESTEAIVEPSSSNRNNLSTPALLRILNSHDHDNIMSGVSKASWVSIWMLIIIQTTYFY
jgi:hypothetical protein